LICLMDAPLLGLAVSAAMALAVATSLRRMSIKRMARADL